jgi:hypothetical protein
MPDGYADDYISMRSGRVAAVTHIGMQIRSTMVHPT